MNPFDLSGRTALVTGASSGLGTHFARALARHGARTVLAARRKDRLAEQVDEIRSSGGEALAVPMDVTDAQSIAAAFDQAERHFDTVNLLINNAGIAESRKALDTPEESWDAVLDTNLKGTWLVAGEAARRMIEQRLRGSIVNVASILGLRGAVSQSSYAASKAAVLRLTEVLALEWMRAGIRVNALCPGYVETEMNRDFFATERGQEYVANLPQGRLGTAEELEGPLLLLASEAGSFVNGVALAVDGGHLLKGL